jgi:predicted ATPase
MEEIVSFGHWLKLRRQALRLTQEMLASRVHCSSELIRKIEADARRPSPVIAKRLTEHLGLSPHQQAAFVKVARGELRVDRLPPPMQVPAWPDPDVPVIHSKSLPVPATPLIGRQAELAELGALLKNPACRLITIAGPGGMGKTRLALAAATDQAAAFRHGAVYVSFADLSSATFLAPKILTALDVVPQGQRDPREQLLAYLREKELLLLLDNFEHLLAPRLSENEGGATLLADLLQRAPAVTLLVTSRERLALPGEWVFDLSGLSYPACEPAQAIESYSAVQLFMQRASQVRRQFALAEGEEHAVARICRLVEGLPLAIELAAAALRSRSCTAIAAAIETSLTALTAELRAVPERHRSIWATFEHSWRLLSDEERRVFPRLSVFRGGFEEDAATQIAQASPQFLAAFVDKSLLRWDGTARYDMHELARQFANEKLEQAGEAGEIRNQHRAYFLALAEAAAAEVIGPQQMRWLARLEQEHANLQAALQWSLDQGAAELALRFCGALWRFWQVHSHYSVGRHWMEAALAQSHLLHVPMRAQVLCRAGWLANIQGDLTQAQALFEASLTLGRQLEDPASVGLALHGVGVIAQTESDYAQAHTHFDESLRLFRELGDTEEIAWSVFHLGALAWYQGDAARATTWLEESLAYFGALGDIWSSAWSYRLLGYVARAQGDLAQATRRFQKALSLFWDLGDKSGCAGALAHLGEFALLEGDLTRAATLLRGSWVLTRDLGYNAHIPRVLTELAGVATAQDGPEAAARLLEAVETLLHTLDGSLTLPEGSELQRHVTSARAHLDAATFAEAWAGGRGLTLEQAIAYALAGSEVVSASSIVAAAPH